MAADTHRLKLAEDNIEILMGLVASQRKIIADLQATQTCKSTKEQLDRLYEALLVAKEHGQKGFSYHQVADVLGVKKRRAQQLRPHLVADGRFMILRHPRRTNAHVVALKPTDRHIY